VKTITVDRLTWYRGHGPEGSYLLNADTGMKCCMGFLAEQCGFSSREIKGEQILDHLGPSEAISQNFIDSYELEDIYITNDTTTFTGDNSEALREEELTRLCKVYDYNMVFIN